MAASIRNSILRNVRIEVQSGPPPVLLDAFGYFNIQNFTPEPGPYPTFATYDGTYPQSGFLNSGPELQSNDPSGAVGYLTIDGYNGDYSLGAGTGAAIDIQPMSIGATKTLTLTGVGNIAGSRFTFPMLMTDSVHLVAYTGDGGGGLYTAGSMTIVIGPSPTAGERYLISWPAETLTPPPDAFISMQRLTDVGPRP